MKATVNDLTGDLLAAFVAAPADRKEAALQLLRGEAEIAKSIPLPQPARAEPYLTLKECARQLGVSACSLWRWGVPGHELGGRPKFKISEIEAYLGSEKFRQRVAKLREEEREKRERRKT